MPEDNDMKRKLTHAILDRRRRRKAMARELVQYITDGKPDHLVKGAAYDLARLMDREDATMDLADALGLEAYVMAAIKKEGL